MIIKKSGGNISAFLLTFYIYNLLKISHISTVHFTEKTHDMEPMQWLGNAQRIELISPHSALSYVVFSLFRSYFRGMLKVINLLASAGATGEEGGGSSETSETMSRVWPHQHDRDPGYPSRLKTPRGRRSIHRRAIVRRYFDASITFCSTTKAPITSALETSSTIVSLSFERACGGRTTSTRRVHATKNAPLSSPSTSNAIVDNEHNHIDHYG